MECELNQSCQFCFQVCFSFSKYLINCVQGTRIQLYLDKNHLFLIRREKWHDYNFLLGCWYLYLSFTLFNYFVLLLFSIFLVKKLWWKLKSTLKMQHFSIAGLIRIFQLINRCTLFKITTIVKKDLLYLSFSFFTFYIFLLLFDFVQDLSEKFSQNLEFFFSFYSIFLMYK